MVLVPAVVTLLVAGYRLGGPSLWRDEAYTKEVVTRSVGQIIALLGHQDAVHGAYYLLMHPVTGAIGTSTAALRVPTLLAMVVAAAFTAAIARAAAAAAGGPAPGVTGLLAGLVFATAAQMTWYAQDAREYAVVTMLATIATWLLVRAIDAGRRAWWVAYGVALVLTGFFNLFAILIVVAHTISLLVAGHRKRVAARRGKGVPAGHGNRVTAGGDPTRWVVFLPVGWLAAVVAAGILLIPLAAVASGQRGQISWLSRPTTTTVADLVTAFAGSRTLVIPFVVLALGGACAGFLAHRDRPLSPGIVALPWLVAPPVILLGVSLAHPVYDARYIEFCLPALAILVAAGLVWLGRLAAATPLRRVGLVWLPSALVVLALAALLVTPQRTIRASGARVDNLRLLSATVTAHEKPGDAVLFFSTNARVLGAAYPAPFRKLTDLTLATTPVASASLNGTDVSPAALRRRFRHTARVWVVAEAGGGHLPAPSDALERTETSLLSSRRVARQWQIREDILRLYVR